eukprot:1408040-Amphidinium_carterae.1
MGCSHPPTPSPQPAAASGYGVEYCTGAILFCYRSVHRDVQVPSWSSHIALPPQGVDFSMRASLASVEGGHFGGRILHTS